MATTPAPAAAPTPAQLAKSALRRLAEQRLEPTPEHYRKAYETESALAGVPVKPDKADKAGVDEAKDGKPEHKNEGKADDKSNGNGGTNAPASPDGEQWATLITRLLRGAERGGRQWTSARKKDSLQRVLQGSRSAAGRLHQRLSQLVGSWDSDTLDSTFLDADEAAAAASAAATASGSEAGSPSAAPSGKGHPQLDHEATPATVSQWPQLALHAIGQLTSTVQAALPAEEAQSQEASDSLVAALKPGQDTELPESRHARVKLDISQACEQARRVIDHRHHLINQLMGLCVSLTDSLSDLSEEDSWVQGQCQAMRHQLDEGINSRGVRHIQQLLSDTREKQLSLKRERDTARQALKQLIHQMLQEIGELGSTTDRFHTNLGRYAETIEQADSLESLTGLVREMVEESGAVQAVVVQTQSRLNEEHARAAELGDRVRQLEDEIRKLSDEVSTDPLTQIANRRGMMRAFEVEQAKMQRDSTTLAIGLLDVDNFKKLNDTLGHQTGDEALKFLARRVTECLRPIDVVSRYGGEEFVVMLPGIALEEAQQVLTRLQRTLSAEFFEHDAKKVFITFSAGVTLYRQGEPIEAALDRSDVALYEAKRTGKNRTCMG